MNAVFSDVAGGIAEVYLESGTTFHWGEGSFDLEPHFRNSASGDYRLTSQSPCIDAGANSFVESLLDLDGHRRIVDGDQDGEKAVDLGAYEFPGLFELVGPVEPMPVPVPVVR